MSREDAQMKIRLPSELKHGIEEASTLANRTMNAEIVNRLQDSFDLDYTGLPFEVVQAVENEMELHGLTQHDALVRLVLAGQSAGGTVLHLSVKPGTSAKEVRDALTEALKHIPADANVVSVRS